MNTSGEQDFSTVAVDKFIQATRGSGYKGTSSAVAELLDNSGWSDTLATFLNG